MLSFPVVVVGAALPHAQVEMISFFRQTCDACCKEYMYLGTPGQLSLDLLQYFQEGVANQGDKVYWPVKMREQDFALKR